MSGEADDDHFELIGQVIDDQKITIKSVVGKGGFSVVYEGWHHVFDERVAIKCLKVPTGYGRAQIRDYFENFRREGKLLLKLTKSTHNVVRIFNMGEITRTDGSSVPYLVLEWLEGEGLDQWFARRRAAGTSRLSLRETLALLDTGAEALARAHAIGVAHRDVKPPNFQVTSNEHGHETVKLLDFGIAKQFDATTRLETQLTSALAYTPSYGAPEQFARDFQRGRVTLPATGPHSDVFSLALVCVELLSGVAPLGEDDNRLVLHHEATRLDQRPTPRTRGAVTSDEVDAVFRTALSVEIASRFESVADFWRALHVAAGLPTPLWLAHVLSPPSEPSIPAPAADRPSAPSSVSSQTTRVVPQASGPPRPSGRRSAAPKAAPIPVLSPLYPQQPAPPAPPKKVDAPMLPVPKQDESAPPLPPLPPPTKVRPLAWVAILCVLALIAGAIALFARR